MVKKITLSILLATILASNASATWKSWAGGAISSTYDTGGTIKTTSTTSFQGPSFRARWQPLGTINPIHMEAPHMSVGCNGIDIGFGAISFINFDQLVEKLKGIASAAPAFAFKMAIDTVCSQCSTIMQDIEEIIDTINNLSLDSCAIAQDLGNSVGKAIGEGINEGVSAGTYQDSVEADQAKTKDEPSFLKKGFADMTRGLGGLSDDLKSLFVMEKRLYGSVLNSARQNLSASGGLDGLEFVNMVRGLIGDVMVCTNVDNQDKQIVDYGKVSIRDAVQTIVFDGGTYHGVSIVMKSESGADLTLGKIKEMPKDCSYEPHDITFGASDTFTSLVLVKIDAILNKLNNKTAALDATERNIINSLPHNGYIIMNMLHIGAAGIDKKDFAQYIALVNLESQFAIILSESLRIIADLTSKLAPESEIHVEALRSLNARIKNKQKESDEYFNTALKPYELKYRAMVKEKETVLRDRAKK